MSEFKNEDTQLKILSRLKSMEDTQIDIHNVIDSVWGELVRIHDTIKLYTNIDIDKQRREKEELLRESNQLFFQSHSVGPAASLVARYSEGSSSESLT